MSEQLTRFRVDGLHGLRTIDVKITNDRLILVGENGTGKSTIANFIYFFLTQQWDRMLTYKFKSISATVGSQEFVIDYDEIPKSRRYSMARKLPQEFDIYIRRYLREKQEMRTLEEILQDRENLKIQASKLGLPFGIFYDTIQQLAEAEANPLKKFEELRHVLKKMDIQVLYLPTYRRIEQDLSSIFPKIASEVKSEIERLRHRAEDSNYVELVEFGMQDVVDTIQAKMGDLRKTFLDDYNNLTGIYLQDVLLGTYRNSVLSKVIDLDENIINAIFNRIGKSVLSEQLQTRLRNIIAEIKKSKIIQENDKVAVHFLTRLIELHKNQQEKEEDIREFVKVSNNYLSDKTMVYDNLKFDISILLKGSKDENIVEKSLELIQMKMLSSGEKQIISLFSQMYLSGNSNYFVIIDEPELSLSVYWQKRFLPDILASNKCKGLIATTHSPFIFENELESFTHLLDEFVEPFNVDA